MNFQVREYPNGQPSTIMDRGILVSTHATWADAVAKAEKLDAEGRGVYVCQASEAFQPVKL